MTHPRRYILAGILATLIIVTGIGLAVVVQNLDDGLEELRRTQVEGIERGYKNRAVACAAIYLNGNTPPQPCFDREVRYLWEPTRLGA